jgi:hypothetical protein
MDVVVVFEPLVHRQCLALTVCLWPCFHRRLWELLSS